MLFACKVNIIIAANNFIEIYGKRRQFYTPHITHKEGHIRIPLRLRNNRRVPTVIPRRNNLIDMCALVFIVIVYKRRYTKPCTTVITSATRLKHVRTIVNVHTDFDIVVPFNFVIEFRSCKACINAISPIFHIRYRKL